MDLKLRQVVGASGPWWTGEQPGEHAVSWRQSLGPPPAPCQGLSSRGEWLSLPQCELSSLFVTARGTVAVYRSVVFCGPAREGEGHTCRGNHRPCFLQQ